MRSFNYADHSDLNQALHMMFHLIDNGEDIASALTLVRHRFKHLTASDILKQYYEIEDYDYGD